MALFEALKGLLVILAGLGLVVFVHHDTWTILERLAFNLNPARHYPRIFIEVTRRLTNAQLALVATGAFAYSSLRFTEAYGLWRARAWGQWIGIISGVIYLPVAVIAMFCGPSVLKVILLVLNILLIAYLSFIRYRQSRS
ncbi:MAG: DUF2127 domain-containing protein [Chloracidobacterium sp.]|nr:DUF2127 domain-containing protein [Chloracidobacterium sp.]